MKNKKATLFRSVMALLLCVSMLVGTTFAWFTDSVVTGINEIAAGNLDVELYHSNAAVAEEKVNSNTELFMDLQGDPILWEPGVVSYENLRVTNEGDLALTYQMTMNTANENFVIDPATGAQHGLSEVLKVGVVEGGVTATDRAGVMEEVTEWIAFADFLREGSLLTAGSEKTFGIVIYWESGESDNLWNLNNGKSLNEGDVLSIDLGVKLVATQTEYESDSFGTDYDGKAKDSVFAFPENEYDDGGSANVTPDAEGKLPEQVILQGQRVRAIVPAGVKLADGVSKLTLSVNSKTQTESNVSLEENEAMRALDVHIEGIAADNTVPMTILIEEAMSTGLNMGNYKLYHVENGSDVEMTYVAQAEDLAAHNQFSYDPATGDVTLSLATFSEVTFTMNTENAWNGDFNYGWYDADAKELIISNADQLAAFGAIVGGMKVVTGKEENGYSYTYSDTVIQDYFDGQTIKLISDINLGDDEENNNSKLIFYPIGYYNTDRTYEKTGAAISSGFSDFEGTFDGQGHTIANFYQNTWEMKGDHDWYDASLQYYRDGMGLFGKVYGGTIKNLTVDNFKSDGEIATTGVIAAYAEGATFENISITNCNPRVYNIGNGGVVGCVGWYAKEAGLKTTFKNITVDNSNKISALWGSYDVACGGIVGQYYPTSGQTSANKPANGGIDFVNCHIAAQMDVYNDVCANYQYYAYRYTGMLIGSVRENVTIDGHTYPKMDNIAASGCTVHFGDWNDYYYCELVANSLASYTHDHQMSRLEQVASVDEANMRVTKLDGKEMTLSETGTYNFVVVNSKNSDGTFAHATEKATCYHFKNGQVWNHDDAGTETVDGKTVLKEDKQHIYLEFNNLVTGYGWGVTTKVVGELDGVKILDREIAKSNKKFETKFTGDFLYYVGNQNDVTIGNLFAAAKDEAGNEYTINDAGIYVTIEKLVEESNVSGTFTADTKSWQNSKIKFSGTGLVKITIQDYDYCKPTELIVEVINAQNAEPDNKIRSAESYNVALLGNISDGFTVSNGHTFYGNGFTVRCAGKGTYLNHGGMTRGYVNVEGGVLDNTQVICDIYPEAFAYTEEVKVESNLDKQASTTDKLRYMYQLSAIAVSGDGGTVSNCYAYGGRNNIYVGGGNVTIENTVTECGTLSNIQIKSTNENCVTLRDVTTIQYKTQSTYNPERTMLGFGILVGDNESTSNPTLKIQNSLTQYNWVTSDDTNISNDYAKQAIEAALNVDKFKHTKDGKTTVNTGIVHLNNIATAIDDQRKDHGYILELITVKLKDPNTGLSGSSNVRVYSLGKSSGNYETNEDTYKPNAQGDVLPAITFTLGNQAVAGEDRYLKGDINGIEARYEKGQEAFNLDITKLFSASKHDVNLSVTATCVDPEGNELSGVVTLSKAGTYMLKFTVKDDVFFTPAGGLLDKVVEREYTVPLALTIAEPAIADATITITKNTWKGEYTNASADGSKNLSFNLLEGVTVTDAGSTFNLKSGGTAVITYSAFSGGEGNAFGGETTITVTYTNGQVLTMKFKKATGNVPGDPKTVTYAVSTGTVKSDKQLKKDSCTAQTWEAYGYSFKGLNGKTITSDAKVTITVDKDTSGGGCVTGDTLVTLADGTQKRVDALVGNEHLVAWDFYKGEYTVAPVGAIVNHGYDVVNEVTMQFADGSTIKTLRGHGFYDVTANKFVIIDENNIEEYVGHKFVKYDGTGNDVTTLVSYSVKSTYNEIWTIVTAFHFNCVLNGLLTLSPTDFADSPAYLMPFEIGAGMKYDAAKMQADIAKYGQYTYEDFADYCTYDQFLGFAFANWKVAVGKGYIQFKDIIYLIENYVNN